MVEGGSSGHGETGEELAAIPGCGLLQVAAIDCGEERIPVRRHPIAEREVGGLGDQDVFVEGLPDVPEGLAEDVAGAFRFGVGPEQVENVFAGGGAPGGEGEVAEESQGLSGAEERGAVVGAGEREAGPTQSDQLEGGVVGKGLGFSFFHLTGA